MSVTPETVARVASLARLALDPADVPELGRELNAILGWIDQLQGVETAGVAPMDAVIPITRAWRDDQVTDGNLQAAVLANAPHAAHGFFAVPKVIE